MATVQVNSWSEFVAAVAVSGDTVVCPEGAVWDMNEIAPEGISTQIVFRCAVIEGNGTTIRNLHGMIANALLIPARMTLAVNALHIENFIMDASSLFAGAVNFSGCRLSGLTPASVRYLVNGVATFTRCAIAWEAMYNNGSYSVELSSSTAIPQATYCRIAVDAPDATLCYIKANWSYIRINCPQQTGLFIGHGSIALLANVYDGELPLVTGVVLNAPAAAYKSVYNAETLTQFPGTASVIGVTEAQLRDPAYLSSIGFPIGVEV